MFRQRKQKPATFRLFTNLHHNKSFIDPKTTNASRTTRFDEVKVVHEGSLPASYFFDGKERKKIIESMIQSYFEPCSNPELQSKTTAVSLACSNKSIPFEKSPEESTNSASGSSWSRKLAISSHRDSAAVQEISRTVNARFFSHRSFVQQKHNNLPTINQEIQLTLNKRPFSQSGPRYAADASPIRRRPSLAATSPLLAQQRRYQSPQNLSPSVLWSRSSSVWSKASLKKLSSTQTQNKYYKFDYGGETPVKIFTSEGSFLVPREQKVKKYGAKTLWLSEPQNNELLLTPHTPLNRELYNKVTRIHGSQPIHIVLPNEAVYESLLANNCQQMKDIIIEMCKQVMQVQGKVMINKICLANLCRLEEKVIRVIDWSGAAFREQLTNLDQVRLVYIADPVLKEAPSTQRQENIVKWICQPEYLAPELIHNLREGKFDNQALWGAQPWASDIWSIGCLIVEMLTLIPLGARERHTLQARNCTRRGLLAVPNFNYGDLLRKQKLFSTQAVRVVRKQCADLLGRLDTRILEVLQRMLKFSKSDRMSPEEAIKILSA